MLEFDNIENSFRVAGRGVAYSSSKWRLPEDVWEPWDLSGEVVRLAGVEVKIIGVDAFAIGRSKSHPYTLPFALLVSFEDAEKIQWQ